MSYFSKTAATAARSGVPFRVRGPNSAGGVDDDDFARVVGRVEECVWDARRQVGEAAFVAVECLLADPDRVSASQDVDRLFLSVVDV